MSKKDLTLFEKVFINRNNLSPICSKLLKLLDYFT